MGPETLFRNQQIDSPTQIRHILNPFGVTNRSHNINHALLHQINASLSIVSLMINKQDQRFHKSQTIVRNNKLCRRKTITMNQATIELNNLGVQQLSQGDYYGAFQSLAKAAENCTRNHAHTKNTGSNIFFFHWHSTNTSAISTISGKEGSTTFLCSRTLTISTNNNEKDIFEERCPCGYVWAIWFNLALCCTMIGTRLGPEKDGKAFMEMSYSLYERVQYRVDSELQQTPHNGHWMMMSMVVSNNQACIFHEFCMHEHTQMCLQRLATALESCDQERMAVEDRGDFCLNLQILTIVKQLLQRHERK